MSKNRLSGAFSAIDAVRASQPDAQNAEVPKHLDILALEPLGAKMSDVDEKVRMSAYLRRSTYKGLKHAAIEEERDMSAIIDDLVSQWLNNRG